MIRAGMTWFCFTRAQLRDEASIERLFRSWGGEALYNSHEGDEETGPLLKSLGRPCIVVATVPVVKVATCMEVGRRLVNIWRGCRGIATGDLPEFDGSVCAGTSGTNILRIIHVDDPEFLALTSHDRWQEPLT